MRVGVAGILHESNSFLRKPTTLDDFRQVTLMEGEAMGRKMLDGHHEISGALVGLGEEGIEAVPLMYAWTTPSGLVTDAALTALLEILWSNLEKAGRLDGLIVCPHGAAISEKHLDMDGYWLGLLRQRVGPTMPIVCTLDAHANVSQAMLDAVNATIVYRSNPHVDQRQRGLEAARLMGRILRKEVRPTQAGVFPGIAINIERQHTPSAPCKPMYDLADAMLKHPGVLSNSIALGFPYSDVPEMGSGFIVVTDNDLPLAQRLAAELADYLISHREEFKGQFTSVDSAVDRALAAKGPVCLLDMGDNVGGGSAGDGTVIAEAMNQRHHAGKKFRAFVAICDPESQASARHAGVGKKLALRIGGKTDDQHGNTLDLTVTVRSLHDGKFTETQVRHGGLRDFDMGPTAIVETDGGLTIQLTSLRTFPTSLLQITSCGLKPEEFQIIVAKGVQAPVAAYAPVCPTLIRVNTPGSTTADMNLLTYQHRRKPLFPFEDVFGNSAK